MRPRIKSGAGDDDFVVSNERFRLAWAILRSIEIINVDAYKNKLI